MSGTAKRLAEAANQIVNPQPIAEAFKNGDKVKVPHKGKMVSGRIIRYDDGGTDKARQSGGGYVVDVGEPASILVPKEKVQKEAVVTEAEWKSLKKTKVDLNALRQKGYKISVQHGEGDTLYKITGKPSKPTTAKKEEVEEAVEQIDEVRSSYTDELLNAIEKAYKKGGLRGVIKGDEQVSDTTVDEVLRDMKPLFGNDMEYAVKKIKRLLKPQDYAKYKTKMEGWGEEVEQIDELTKMRRLGQTVGAILSKNPGASTPAQRLKTAQSIRANKQYWTPERIAKQDEIDAKLNKMNAADAVERIKEIINSYDKQTKAMIIAGMKSIKESAEITEAPYTPANDYEGEMAMTQLKSIMEKASDVLGMMKPEAKMEAWVQSKITLADEHISCVRDYLKHTDGAIG